MRSFSSYLVWVGMIVALLVTSTEARAESRHVRLQLKWLHQFQFAGYYAALTKGYFEQAGLEVEILEGAKSHPPVPAVVSGEADFGVHDGGELLYERLRGAPVVALAAVFQHSPYVIVSLEKTGIRTPADLVGRSVMITPDQGSAQILAMLMREGIPTDEAGGQPSVHLVPHSWHLEDLIEGRVDAMSAYGTDEPLMLESRGLDVAVLRPINYGIDFYGDTLFTREAMLAEDPELAMAVRKASMRGWEYAMVHPDEIADYILTLPTERERPPTREQLLIEAEAMRSIVLPELVELGHMNPGRWSHMAHELERVGLAKDTRRLDGFMVDPAEEARRHQALLKPLGYGLGTVLLLVFASLVWVRQLRVKVAERTEELEREVLLREQKTKLLATAEQKTRAILAALPDLVFVNHRDGTILDFHAREGSDLVVPSDSILGSKPQDLLPPEVADPLCSLIRKSLDTNSIAVAEFALDVHGETRALEARTVPFEDDQTVTLIRNITDQKAAQERLALLAATVEQAAEEIVITDADNVIRYVNPSFEKSTGYTSAEVVGKKPSVLSSGKHDSAFYEEMYTALSGDGVWKGRFTNQTKSGQLILQDATIVAIRDAAGKRIGYVSVRRDVTKQVEMETQLAQSQRMQAIGTLAGGIAHDFNNVLAGVIGYAELAMEHEGNPPETETDLEEVLRAARRASQLTKRILAFSRGVPDDVQPLPIRQLVNDALKLVRAAIPSSVEIQLHASTEAHVLVAPGDMQRMIVNLCTNASLAIGAAPGHVEIELDEVELDASDAELRGGLAEGRYVRLSVSDDGCGMTSEVQSRLFEPFFTTRKSGEGTGLGLSVVHGIVKSRGGAIQVQSMENQGSRFDIWLPAHQPRASSPDAPAEGPTRGAGRILFVDDETMVTKLFKRALERYGYEVDTFNSSTDALRAFEAEPSKYDLVVTDLAMPKLRGDDLAMRVKAIRDAVPILLCTGHDPGLGPETVNSKGVDRVLHKPLTVSQMANAVRDALQGSSPAS